MSKKSLSTTAMFGMLAGEIFLIHPNLENQRLGWPAAFAIWVIFGIITGYLGDRAYNKYMARKDNKYYRLALICIVAFVIFCLAYIYSKIVFLLA